MPEDTLTVEEAVEEQKPDTLSVSEAEEKGWTFVHAQEELVNETGDGVSKTIPANLVAEKYVNDTLVTEQAETEEKLLERISAYEGHLASDKPATITKPVASGVQPSAIEDVILPGENEDGDPNKISSQELSTLTSQNDTLVTKDGTKILQPVASAEEALAAHEQLAAEAEDERVSFNASPEGTMGSPEYAEADANASKGESVLVETPADRDEKTSAQIHSEAVEEAAKAEGALADKAENAAKIREAGGKAVQAAHDKAAGKDKSLNPFKKA